MKHHPALLRVELATEKRNSSENDHFLIITRNLVYAHFFICQQDNDSSLLRLLEFGKSNAEREWDVPGRQHWDVPNRTAWDFHIYSRL